MSTQVELMPTMDGQLGKMDEKVQLKTLAESERLPQSQQHPLHQFDFKIMNKFYESCVGKLKEQNPKWKPTEWSQMNPMPSTLSWEQKYEWPNPQVFSQKQRVYEAFARLARESGEPMVLMPSFDYGDLVNFDRFLQALKQDGVNAIGKYKQYLNNKETRKLEVDLVVLHARYGILLIEVRDCDHLDMKRRTRARAQLNLARNCFQSMARLIIEAKGWSMGEASIPIMELIALPNMYERPQTTSSPATTQPANLNQSTSSSSGRSSRQLNFLIKSDLESSVEFAKWWTQWVVEPRVQQQQQAEAEQKVNKYDLSVMNWMMGLINCVRSNLIVPVVYPESPSDSTTVYDVKIEPTPGSDEKSSPSSPSALQFQPALNVHAEFFTPAHEQCRSMSRVMVVSKCAEKIRKTICLQTMWMLLNDSQKKISVVCSEVNKQYYEEFFARQRKLYNNLNNVRFYSDLHSCAVNAQSHTLKKEGEIWFFDSGINGPLSDVIERVKELNAFWMFTTQEEQARQYKTDLTTLKVKQIHLDETRPCEQDMPWLSGVSLKLPLRLQCDLLIVGDMIGQGQLKQLYRYLKSNTVMNQANSYNRDSHGHHGHYYHNHPQQQPLNFNPTKKFKSVKFIRGGSIDNLRNSLKMHDSIQAPVIIMHVGDEDLFKTRTSLTTIERVKELATLVKEYCPKSFVVLSTLMRRMSKTENSVTNEVNKGIINFCKQTKDSLNCFYMLNSHFEPDYHTQEGRLLSNKGLRLYVDNILFVVDYFLIRNNKQH